MRVTAEEAQSIQHYADKGYAAGFKAGLEAAAKALKDNGDHAAPYFVAVINALLDKPSEPPK
jgi:hypothetical protein